MLKRLLLLALLLAGCGSGSTTTTTAGVPTLPVEEPTGGSGGGAGADPVFGRAYLLLRQGAVEVHSALNNAPPRGMIRGSRYADFIMPLPNRPATRCISHDAVHDRLYVGCEGQLLIYSEASRLTVSSQPTAILPLRQTPISASYDEGRDLLYLGLPTGQLARLPQAAQATNSTSVAYVSLTAGGQALQVLTGLTVDGFSDRLLLGGTPRVGLPTTMLRYSSASSTCDFRGQSAPPTLEVVGRKMEMEHERLLVFNNESQLQRYEPTNDYGDPATLQGYMGAFHYDRVTDFLLASQPFVEIYLQFSKLDGELREESSSAIHLIPGGDVVDIAYDPFR